MNDNMSHVPPKQRTESEVLKDSIKILSNSDVNNILRTVADRINDMYAIILALEGISYNAPPKLLSITTVHDGNVTKYIKTMNGICDALLQKLNMIKNSSA